MVDLDETMGTSLVRDLVERLPSAVAYLTGPDHVIALANAAFRQLVGRRGVVGLPLRRALPADEEQQTHVDVLTQALRTGLPAEVRAAEVRVRTAAGPAEPRYLDVLVEPVQGAAGAVAGLLVQVSDVTSYVLDRRRLERTAAELTEAHERYATLFETMVLGIVYHAADGEIVAANPQAAATLGVKQEDLVGLRPQAPGWQAVHEDGSPFPGDEHPATVALRTGRVVTDVVMGVRHGTTGERRWLSVTAVPDAIDEHGRPQRAYAMFKDVTDERRAAAGARDRETLLGRLRDANVLGIVVADEDRVLDANRAFLDMVGHTEADMAAGGVDWRVITPPEWAWADERALDQLRRTGACDPFEKEYVHASGRRVPVLLGAAVTERDPLRWVTFVADLSERQRAKEERAALLARAHAARAEAEAAGERLHLLLGAGTLVAATRDREELLAHVTRLVVPTLADYAAVFLPDEAGRLCVASVAARDPADLAQVERLREVPVSAGSLLPLEPAMRTGHTELIRDVGALVPVWSAADPVFAEVVAAVACDSGVVVALGDGRAGAGVLAMGRRQGRTPFGDSDLEVAEELGRRLSVGLGNVDVFTREHGVAEMLQRSVLPDALPDVPGVQLDVRYLPATEAVDVGGDWYDAFSLGHDRLGVVLGDVVGHNLVSASVMSQVRNALRAYAVDDPDPASVLARTNTAVTRLMPDAMATVFYGVLDVPGRCLTYATAGHPPPLVVSAEGSGYLPGPVGLMLGVAAETSYDAGSRVLTAGTTLLLYSDGLVEDRARSLAEGLAVLADAFADDVPDDPADICDRAQATMSDPAARADDVCLLAVRLSG